MASRRGAGEGTIVKRKTCLECKKIVSAAVEKDLKKCKHCQAELPKDGTWMAAALVGFDVANNKPCRKYFYGKTRAEVSEKMQEAKGRLKSGNVTEPSKMLLAEWLDRWLNDYMKPSLRQTTWQSYETQVRKHLKPAIGHVRLNALQTAHLQQLYNSKLTGGRADSRDGGLSPRSVRYIHNTIHGALEQAKKEGMILVNPADNVKLPKQEKKEIQYLDTEGIRKLLKTASGTRHYAAYYLELATGLRRGELLALRWRDVDIENRAVSVTQGLVRVNYEGGETKTKLVFQQPKTALASRTISIPPDVAEVLRFRKRQQEGEREAAGEAWLKEIVFTGSKPERNDLVFTNLLGSPLDPRSFTHGFDRLLKQAGLPKMSFHALRHTFATMSLQEGVDIRTTQENLGHHAAAFTLDVYSSVTAKMKKEATDKIGNLLTSCLK